MHCGTSRLGHTEHCFFLISNWGRVLRPNPPTCINSKGRLGPHQQGCCQRLVQERAAEFQLQNFCLSQNLHGLSGTRFSVHIEAFLDPGGFSFLFFPPFPPMLGQSMKRNRRICRGETDVCCSFHNHRAGEQ